MLHEEPTKKREQIRMGLERLKSALERACLLPDEEMGGLIGGRFLGRTGQKKSPGVFPELKQKNAQDLHTMICRKSGMKKPCRR